jgi:hypothetical protein
MDASTSSEHGTAPKIPLILKPLSASMKERYLDNPDYTIVYQRERYRNSQELLYYNLKYRPDPQVAPEKTLALQTKK